ncbi:hypothetical protein SAMN05660297_00734 [Natronincola peptidivorans]|uniref:Transglutaminase-like superfamily protein n=1 Tax=Natronincola peptidivorans TaxID=426128 RepID=A0A1H9ZUN5_9FIRM|nr:hypothetical protein [Natronincola peptidivorans]SES85493.1 hypothetical protein SAMN05660297_00734 [Natronincola peptidivorans]
MKKRVLLVMLLFFSVWTLFVLYPNPYRLGASIYRVIHPATNTAAVEDLAARAPSDPKEIEKFVLEEIPYQYDWQTYGMPFYFPTAEEAIAKGTGDCKSRFVVLASVFEAKGIPYKQSFSLSHFWIDYEDKTETAIERSENAFLLRTEEGTKIQLPREDLQDVLEVLKEGFWDYMPLARKILLVLGLPIATMIGFLYHRFITKKKEPQEAIA